MVLGPGGAGKSVLARRLGEILGLPVIHLDRLYWRPGWEPTPPEEWIALQEQLVESDAWIVDGNYTATLGVRTGRANTVVFLDFPRRLCLGRLLRRWATHRGRDLQAPGCPEQLGTELLGWLRNYGPGRRLQVPRSFEQPSAYPELVVLRRPAEADLFLDSVDPVSV